MAIIDILNEYFKLIIELGNPICWDEVEPTELKDSWTACFIGQCGTGKSTALTLISKLYSEHFEGAMNEPPFEFMSASSSKAVTQHVKAVKVGNSMLIDTPGTNDPDRKRTDK